MNTVSMKAAILMAALFSVGFPTLLHADELSVEERLAKLERLDNSRNLVQVEMQQQIDALSDEVRQLRGSLEEANYKLQQATERQKGLYQELDKLKASPNPAEWLLVLRRRQVLEPDLMAHRRRVHRLSVKRLRLLRRRARKRPKPMMRLSAW